MSELRNPADTAIATEAADWYARLRAPDVSDIDAARFRAWLAGDPGRRREFESIDAFWNELSAIENSPEVLHVRNGIAARRRRTRRVQTRTSWAVAATLLVSIGGALLAWQQWSAGRFVTEVGEQRTVPLADGSIIMLNTDTELRLDYSGTARRVELLRGQANFEVARDPQRPFVVTAGDVQVRAVGTVFDIYRAMDRVTVTLIEGKVAVSSADAAVTSEDSRDSFTENQPAGANSPRSSGSQRLPAPTGSAPVPPAGAPISATFTGGTLSASGEIIMAAGEQLSYASAAGSVERAIADVPRVSAWRRRKLDFSDTPLLEAIAEANRYSREQIVLQAPALQDARISGTFEAGKNDVFAEGLQSYFRLDLERTADDRIVLSAR